VKPFTITIAQRLRPFSHAARFCTLIPKTNCLAEIFPARLVLEEWQGARFSTLLPLTGPVEQFTSQVEGEKGRVRVFGRAAQGFFSYLLFAQRDGIYLYLEKGPLPFPLKQEHKLLNISSFHEAPPEERLSLGMHRSLEWESVLRRGEFQEIFPVWLQMGQLLPQPEERTMPEEGNFLLLEKCRKVVEQKEKLHVIPAFRTLFLAAFSSLFVPHVNDLSFQGLSTPTEQALSPLPLLKKSALLIRSLFFQEEKESCALLPLLPPQFHSGRFCHIKTKEGDRIDMEWSSKLLRRLRIQSAKSRSLRLIVQSALKRCRVRTKLREKGRMCNLNEPLELQSGVCLYLDRFQG